MDNFDQADAGLLDQVDIVLTDVDDTLTRHGQITATTLTALTRLQDAGICVIPVTGGCAGWCDHMVRAWPVAAVIGESGAFCFTHSAQGGIRQRFVRPRAEMQAEQKRLLGIAQQALRAVPESQLAADQPYRLVDVALDHAQDIGPLPAERVATLIDIFRHAGARARASSIHINAWFGDHDKASTASWLLREELGLAANEQARRVLFIGDAPNDESMFRSYPLSVGVANIGPHLQQLTHRPRWLCAASHYDGFAEMADRLLAVRSHGGKLGNTALIRASDKCPRRA